MLFMQGSLLIFTIIRLRLLLWMDYQTGQRRQHITQHFQFSVHY